jgi:anti-anti-sigma factor
MVDWSKNPEDQPERCGVCGSELKVEPATAAAKAPCPRCGHLVWFTWEDLGDVEIIKPTGDLLTREALGAFLDSVAMKPGTHLVLDLSEVHFFASAALAQMVGLKKRVKSVGGRFTIRNVRPELLEVFRITRLEHVFDMEP